MLSIPLLLTGGGNKQIQQSVRINLSLVILRITTLCVCVSQCVRLSCIEVNIFHLGS